MLRLMVLVMCLLAVPQLSVADESSIFVCSGTDKTEDNFTYTIKIQYERGRAGMLALVDPGKGQVLEPALDGMPVFRGMMEFKNPRRLKSKHYPLIITQENSDAGDSLIGFFADQFSNYPGIIHINTWDEGMPFYLFYGEGLFGAKNGDDSRAVITGQCH